MIVADAALWKRLSPLLDEILELPPVARADRLARLRDEDTALAAELAALVDDAARADEENFLAGSAEVATAAATLAGTRIGAYVLDVPLGQGGTGAVWRAHRADGRFEGAVAVKLLHPSLIGRTGARRFEREGAILARLSHPNISRLLDAGVSAGGQPYLVLELVGGDRIDRHCDRLRLRIDERLALFRVVLDAVAHAHRHLVIHRDIKPSNILVTAEGDVKLLDFGIAKLLQGDVDDLTGGHGGALTPDYAAPEQLRGEEVTTATDVYSLGVLLYQLLTGKHPTAPPRASAADLMRTTLQTDPGPLAVAVTTGDGVRPADVERITAERDTSLVRLKRQLGGDLDNIVAKALRKAPAERYATVDAFDDDLRRWSAGEPVSARPDSVAYRTARFVSRHRGAVAASALTIAAIVIGLVGTISQAHRAEVQSERATREAETARRERDEAIEQQRLQRGMNEFLQLLMRDAAGRDPGAIRSQLDRAAVLVEQTRFEHPVVKVALQRQIAGRYGELGEWSAAARLLGLAVASLAGTELAAPTSAVPVNLECSLARALEEAGDLKGARGELDRADRLIAAGARVSLPSQVECRVQRSYLATAEGDHASGVAILRGALDQLAAAGTREGEQTRVIRSGLGRALGLAGEPGAGLAIARPVLDESIAGQGRESIAVLRRSGIVTALTRLGGDPLAALARSEADRATAAQIGGAARVDAAIELEHGLILSELARFDAAAATLAAAASAAADRALLRLDARLAEVDALISAGRLPEAGARFAALTAARATAPAPEQIEASRIAGRLALAGGDLAAATRELELAATRIAASAPPHPQQLALDLTRGELALAARRDADALALADAAVVGARGRAVAAERSSDVGRALLLRAHALAAAGRREDARADAERARGHLESTLGAAHPATRTASALSSASASASPAPAPAPTPAR